LGKLSPLSAKITRRPITAGRGGREIDKFAISSKPPILRILRIFPLKRLFLKNRLGRFWKSEVNFADDKPQNLAIFRSYLLQKKEAPKGAPSITASSKSLLKFHQVFIHLFVAINNLID
jgi:hypothetical protein